MQRTQLTQQPKRKSRSSKLPTFCVACGTLDVDQNLRRYINLQQFKKLLNYFLVRVVVTAEHATNVDYR